MNPLALKNPLKPYDSACGDLVMLAERELTAFFSAVTALFGAEQAKLSAEEWLHELAAYDLVNHDLSASTGQWRRITMKVAARLAGRVSASSAPQVSSKQTSSKDPSRAFAYFNATAS